MPYLCKKRSQKMKVGVILWKGVDYFLNLLPLVWTFFDLRQIRLDNLVNQLVLLDENKQQVMRRFPHLGLR